MFSRKHPSRDVIFSGEKFAPPQKIISLHDVVLEPWKQALLASRDVIIFSQICVSKLQRVFTLGDGCWLPTCVHTFNTEFQFRFRFCFCSWINNGSSGSGSGFSSWKNKFWRFQFHFTESRSLQCGSFSKEKGPQKSTIETKKTAETWSEEFPSDFCSSLLLLDTSWAISCISPHPNTHPWTFEQTSRTHLLLQLIKCFREWPRGGSNFTPLLKHSRPVRVVKPRRKIKGQHDYGQQAWEILGGKSASERVSERTSEREGFRGFQRFSEIFQGF